MPKETNSRSYLMFVDANIFLDYYRTITNPTLSLLGKLDTAKDKLIISCQTEMEFKKNRRSVINMSLDNLPSFGKSQIPVFLRDTRAVKSLKKREREARAYLKQLKDRAKDIQQQPKQKDPVYKAFQRLVKVKSPWNLQYGDEDTRNQIAALAERRFQAGYPPRKARDTSNGDAFHWEWIVSCALRAPSATNVIIVSRDGDFDNLWLIEEFERRVGSQSRLILTELLAEGLKLLNVEVTSKEI